MFCSQTTNDVNIKANATAHQLEQNQQGIKSSEDSLIKRNVVVRKRLHFSNYDEVESIFADSKHHANQSESSIAFGRLIDEVHIDATTFSSSNDEDTIPSSQHTEISNDMSPERNHASSIHNGKSRLRKIHDDIIPETDLDEDYEDDVCNMTFTQRVSQKMESDSQTLSLQKNIHLPSNSLITITTKYKPPDPARIVESMALYDIPKCRAEKPFFSNKFDLAKYKESSNAKALFFDIPTFKSGLEDITSIKLWRRMKVNEFYPSGSNIKTCHLKRTLAGYNLLTIKPLMTPPSFEDVRNWVRAKEYLSKKEHDAKTSKLAKEKVLPTARDMLDPPIHVVNKDEESRPGTSDQSISTISSIERSVSLLSGTSDDDRKFEYTQDSNDYESSGNTLNSSLRKALDNPLLYKQNETIQRFSYGQIEYSSKGSYSNVSNENLQNARAVTTVNFILYCINYTNCTVILYSVKK